MRKGHLAFSACLLVLGLTAAGLAAPGPASFKELLYEAAKKEGQVNLWGPPADTVDKFYPQEFQRAFPGITVKAVGDPEAPQKILTEALARRLEADVFFWPINGFIDLHKRGLLARFEPDALKPFGITPDDTTLNGRGLKAANVIYTLAYDTRKFKVQDLPKTWEDMLDPRWRGRIVSSTLLAPGIPTFLGLMKGEQFALDFARSLRDQARITLVSSSLVGLQMVYRGEKDLLIWLIPEVLKAKHHRNEPVDWVPLSPTYSTQHMLGVLQRAPHLMQKGPRPNAALLFALWGGSKEGKVAMEKAS
ncbi:MAG: extracellular solute-binding protein, partial [Acidobacteria bacterium]|nr:extracellular solute-binding protein [Acidobacteriota bacterium]